jgi:hypothetical protein
MFWKRSRHFIQPAPVMFFRTTSPQAVPDRLTPAEFVPRAGSDLQGYWTGVIEGLPTQLQLNLKIAESWDGSFRGEIDSPMEGVCGAPLIVKYERPLLKIPDAVEHLLIQGTVSSNSTEIIGSVTTGGRSSPIRFQRADYEGEHKRDGERRYAFSSTDELQGHWSGSWMATVAKTKAKIRLALDIAKFPDGSYLAELRKIDDLGEDAPIAADEFEFKAPEMNLRWKWLKVGFEGRLERGKIVGHWEQGGGSFPLVLERNK